nr:glyceraldehyde-3-phosphate dehydrogenase [Oceanococcus sp. HetDA_MAG_MS8]
MTSADLDLTIAQWDDEERAAEAMVPLVGQLYRNRSVEVSVYGQLLVKRAVSDILKAHEFSRQVEDAAIHPSESLKIVELLGRMPVERAHVDVGKLATRFRSAESGLTLEAFLQAELAPALEATKEDAPHAEQKDVVLFGFGRIGRIVARLLCDRPGSQHGARLRAIVVRKGKGDDLEKRASLLRFDSVHGPFKGIIDVDRENQAMIINGQRVQVIYADKPEAVDYAAHGISGAVLVDNTGAWRDEEGLSRHLSSGAISQVVLTAPGKGDLKNIVHGLNQDMIAADDQIISAASCTTNAIAPVLKAINDKYGIVSGHMETVHSYTNDQNLIDNYHGANRRGRSAPLNMVLTETGATKAVGKALPELVGKLTGSSVRVPTANVSLAVLSLNLEGSPSTEELNDYLRHMAMHSELQKQIGFSKAADAVSSDFVGMRSTGVVDGPATQTAPNRCVVYVWYDNEFGYTCQVVRILRQLTHSTLRVFPS